MNISTLKEKCKLEKTRQDVMTLASPIKTFNNYTNKKEMVTNSLDDKQHRLSKTAPTSHSNRLNGYTILQETPVVSRLIVKRDNSHQRPNACDDITKTTTTITLYKCHLCCSVCPTLNRMRCHLVFHCRKENLKCLSFKVQSNQQDPDHDTTFNIRQESGELNAMDDRDVRHLDKSSRVVQLSNNVAENLSLHKSHTNSIELKPLTSEIISVGGSYSESGGVECDVSTFMSGSCLKSERMKETYGMHSYNSATYFDLTSRKRGFSIIDDYCNVNSLSAKHINADEKNDSKRFSPNIKASSNFDHKSDKNYLENGGVDFECDSNYKPFNIDGYEQTSFQQKLPKSPISEANDAKGPSLSTYETLTERCLLPQNGPSLFSPYYWLARQHWLSLSRYPEISHQEEQIRISVQENQSSPLNNTSPCASSDVTKGREENAIKASFSLLPTSPRPSPEVSFPTSSPSKSPTPSVDSSSSSPLAPNSFQFYNPLELVKIMRNLTAYSNFLPPAYPFFSMPSNFQNYPSESTYKLLENQQSDSDDASHAATYPSVNSISQPQVLSSFSFDKSLTKNLHPYYSLLNFSPPSNYNLSQSKFIPNPDAGASSSSPCLTSFNRSQFYKPAFSSDTNFHNTSSKTWPPPCDVKSPSDPIIRKDSKLTTFCKADKSEVMKSSGKRGEACRPIKLADGRTVYHCSQCRKTFTNISDVNRHMDFHEDIRPFKCKFCSYYARTNSQLKVHMMRHQGIRQYVCHLCNYKGVTQSDLNRHTKSQIHVLKSRNECSQCSEGFVSPMNLAQHCKDRHHSSVT